MNEETPMDRALDSALARSLAPPSLPAGFRARLMAAVARSGDVRQLARAQMESEHRQRLAEMEAGYLRLQRRTLGTLIGAAFVTGALVAVALPLIRDRWGDNAVFLLPLVGGLLAFAIGAGSWLRRSGVTRLFARLLP